MRVSILKENKMTNIDFMKAKNAILREHIGIDFDMIPESQMVETGNQFELNVNGSARSCVYCVEFPDECDICPMYLAGNGCTRQLGNDYNPDSTYGKYISYCERNDIRTHDNESSPAYLPMKELIDRYNDEIL
jgi:hypothetical protein